MDKGIRAACNAKFLELLPRRAELGNKKFRAEVRFYLMEEFSCTGNAASTHYNHSFKECKKANPELVVGLGRPEGKNNGGRKKKVVVTTPAGAADPTLLLGYTPPAAETAAVEGAAEVAAVQEVAAEAEVVPPVEAADKLWNVYKKKGKVLVLLGVSKETAQATIDKAAKAKKSALYME